MTDQLTHLDRTGDPEQQHAYAPHWPFVYARHLHWADTEAAVYAQAIRDAEAVRAEILAAEARAPGRPRWVFRALSKRRHVCGW